MPFGWKARSPAERAAAIVWLLVLVAGVGLCIQRRWVGDDIYITLRYSDNVLAGLGPVYNAGERTEGYTHFLWFLVLTIGRFFGIEAATLGRWAPIPFYALTLVLLVRLSRRLFPGRGGWFGVPVAAIAWAVHEDARDFGSGGLETAAFTAILLVAFELVCLSSRRRRGALAGWALAIACMLRPDGLLYTLLAAGFLAWRARGERRVLFELVGVWLLLAAPHFAFRMAYYGYPLPNPYYAKSGGLANWPQGLLYGRLYFQAYFVLLAAFPAAALAAIELRRRPRSAAGPTDADAARIPAALLFAAIAATLTILYVLRVGGDFMFARFFLPVTPFLLLLVESLVQRLPRPSLRVGGGVAVAALVAVGIVLKHQWLSPRRLISGIVDERQFYPEARLREVRQNAKTLAACLEGTQATLLVQGGQASLAYYARFPVAIENFGLTDATIAHGPIQARGRPGHEKSATLAYVYQRGVNLRINYNPVRSAAVYTLFAMPGFEGEILVYDRPLMEHLKSCPSIRFLDFPRWLAHDYIPSIPQLPPAKLLRDWSHFQVYYFRRNPDPEGLEARLQSALAARGITQLPTAPVPAAEPLRDLGRPAGEQ